MIDKTDCCIVFIVCVDFDSCVTLIPETMNQNVYGT